ncbi:MAG: 30S ribosomal protein THX [Flavobacteriales bacterium]|nr:30S ribosomal protein THX [Flavobacteriales bacterium]
MGRGDKKTAKGKRTMGSYGNTRKRASKKLVAVVEKVEATSTKKTTKKESAK